MTGQTAQASRDTPHAPTEWHRVAEKVPHPLLHRLPNATCLLQLVAQDDVQRVGDLQQMKGFI